jgi:hypothetical protein
MELYAGEWPFFPHVFIYKLRGKSCIYLDESVKAFG